MSENEAKRLTPIKAIRAKCLDCMCGSAHEVRLCPSSTCSLYPYRLGHNPALAGKGKRPNGELEGGFRREEGNDA